MPPRRQGQRGSCCFKQRTVLQMKRFAYLLILLVLSAQVDDVWAVVPGLLPAPLADDNDEYLPAQQRFRAETSSGQEPVFVGLKLHSGNFLFVRRGLPFGWNLTTPFHLPVLYVFMSLQI